MSSRREGVRVRYLRGVNLLIVDDHPLIRQGLRMLLQTIDGQLTVEEAGDLGSALEAAKRRQFDLIVLDLRMPGVHGLGALEALRAGLPEVPVVVVSGEHDAALVRETIERGAMGFIPKSLTPEGLADAFKQVLARKTYLPESLLAACPQRAADSLPQLTGRQLEVLRRVVQGKTNKSVARDLGLSPETVKTHLAAAMRALNAANRTELVYIAAQRGLTLG